MANINIYDVSVKTYIGSITVLINILKKAASHPSAATFPAATLIVDMKPLSFHVQSCSNTVTKSLRRLIGSDIQDWEDNETTMEELILRAEKTLTLLETIDPKTLKGKEGVKHDLPLPYGQMNGKQYIFAFGMPNMFFHLQTTYAILRMQGVPLGKADYIAPYNSLWIPDISH